MRSAISLSRRGFTLIELLVVIAILALLLSLLVPSLKMAKELARRAVCLSNQHQIGNATQAYMFTYDYYLPRGRYDTAPNKAIYGTRWLIRLGSMYGDGGRFTSASNEYLHRGRSMLLCPSDYVYVQRGSARDSTWQGSSYFGNGRLISANDPPNGASEIRVDKISRPGLRLLSTEKWGYWYGSLDRAVTQGSWSESSFYAASVSYDNNVTWTTGVLFGDQHKTVINMTALDGAGQQWPYNRMYVSAVGHKDSTQPPGNPDWQYWRGP
jgi:prepilin-type N-terminal cleavage/methylation domain-containing protein